MLRRSPELDDDEDEVVDMTRLLLPSPLPASSEEVVEVTKDPGYEARLGFKEGLVPEVFFSRRIF